MGRLGSLTVTENAKQLSKKPRKRNTIFYIGNQLAAQAYFRHHYHGNSDKQPRPLLLVLIAKYHMLITDKHCRNRQ